ncbi:MAG: hypothetical protein H7061_11455, partial [Bdellovibrionaceae bacterium]|nr:hypothetical protein [Bdellovibrio sp.]
SKSSSGGFSEVADENKAGSAIYQAAAMAAATYGGVKIAEAGECGTPACAAALTALAMAAFAQMGKAKAQAKRMNNAQYSACNSANQTGAVTTDCGAAPTADDKNPYDPKNVDGIADLDKDGKCKPNSPACEAMVKDPRFKGTDFKAVGGGLSAFASDKNKNKIGKDGTMTLPNGQTTNVDALMSKEGMMKAGMTAAQADALMKQMQGSGAPVASLDSKKELDDLNKADAAVAAEMGALSSGAAGAGTGQNLNGNGMGSKDISKRKPSSEGLTREFHGDTIGAAGDDIFSMMNRRYKLKAEQDTFMGPR